MAREKCLGINPTLFRTVLSVMTGILLKPTISYLTRVCFSNTQFTPVKSHEDEQHTIHISMESAAVNRKQ